MHSLLILNEGMDHNFKGRGGGGQQMDWNSNRPILLVYECWVTLKNPFSVRHHKPPHLHAWWIRTHTANPHTTLCMIFGNITVRKTGGGSWVYRVFIILVRNGGKGNRNITSLHLHQIGMGEENRNIHSLMSSSGPTLKFTHNRPSLCADETIANNKNIQSTNCLNQSLNQHYYHESALRRYISCIQGQAGCADLCTHSHTWDKRNGIKSNQHSSPAIGLIK